MTGLAQLEQGSVAIEEMDERVEAQVSAISLKTFSPIFLGEDQQELGLDRSGVMTFDIVLRSPLKKLLWELRRRSTYHDLKSVSPAQEQGRHPAERLRFALFVEGVDKLVSARDFLRLSEPAAIATERGE